MKKMLTPLIIMVFFITSMDNCRETPEGLLIGLSFSDLSSERWVREEKLLKRLAAEAGAKVESATANHDPKLQNEQIVSFIRKKCGAVIIVAEDGVSCASAVERAAAEGIPCIAYDRFIKTPKIAAYLSFDYREAGRLQASGVLKVKPRGRFALLGGSRTDHSAILMRVGQMDLLKSKIEKGLIKIAADQWVDRWDPHRAEKIMEGVLAGKHDGIDAVIASNDDTALGVIRALRARNLAGRTAVSGGDATADGCDAIAKGELSCTIFKDTAALASLAVDTAVTLAKKQPLAGFAHYKLSVISLDDKLRGEIPCRFLPVKLIDKKNLSETVVKSGSQSPGNAY